MFLSGANGQIEAAFDSPATSTLEIVANIGARYTVAEQSSANAIVFLQVPAGGGAPVLLQSFDGITDASQSFVITGTPGNLTVTQEAPCFAEGTRIATARGLVAVEDLRAGDRVPLAGKAGGWGEVIWLGHRRVDCRHHPRPDSVLPVRVAAHAFGGNQPSRDLYLSPDHAVFTGGVLIPVRYLVNGGSIAPVARDHVTYWHVELAAHGVLLAENLPCESYLDTGNRAAFANGGAMAQAQPDFARGVWAARACAPLAVKGRHVTRAKTRLLKRLPLLGHDVSSRADVRLFADGVELAAHWSGAACRVRLPDGAQRLMLASRTARPADLDPASTDTRLLGAALLRLRLDGSETALDSARFGEGWLEAEATQRWTLARAWLDVRGLTGVEMKFGDWHRYLATAPLPLRAAG
jgi:hypothetical protein